MKIRKMKMRAEGPETMQWVKIAIEGVSVFLLLSGVSRSLRSVASVHFSCDRAVCLNAKLIFRCQHFCPRLLHFAVLVPGLKKGFPCVFCMTWYVSNRMRCVCVSVCKSGKTEGEIECI